MKKTGETNHFILEQAEKALRAMVQNVSSSKAIAILVANAGHKNGAVRAKVAMFLCECIEVVGPKILGSKDLDKLIPLAITFLNEGNFEARSGGKDMCLSFARFKENDMDELEKLLIKYIPDKQSKQFLEVVKKNQKLPGAGVRHSSTPKIQQRVPISKSAPISRKNSTIEFELGDVAISKQKR